MATVNRTAISYVARETSIQTVPVQVGSVRNLCPSLTPAGRGVLSWVDRVANELRIAILDDREDLFENDVVAPGDVRTVYAGGARTVHTGTTAVIGGALYAFVSSWLANNGTIECYVADDVENPTGWTFRGMIQTHTASAGASWDVRQGGVPTVLGSGRWVLPFHSWLTFGGSTLEDGIGLHTSDDAGLSWTTRINFRKGALFSGTAGPQSTTVAENPATGELVFGSDVGPVNQWFVYRSGDGGSSWVRSDLDGPGGGMNPHFYMDNGTHLFAALTTADHFYLYRVGDPTVFASWTDLGIDAINGIDGVDAGAQIVPLWASGALWCVAFTWRDRIVRDRLSGFLVGAVALG